MDISSLRRSYALQSLDESEVSNNPFTQFKQWFEEAVSAQVSEPNAMTLATSTVEGRPSARIVLLKGFDEAGFVFFTNYESRKGAEMTENPMAALLFCWLDLERQIRIEGQIQKISREASEQYFVSRPKSSQSRRDHRRRRSRCDRCRGPRQSPVHGAARANRGARQ